MQTRWEKLHVQQFLQMFAFYHVSSHFLRACSWLLEKFTKKQLKAIAVIAVDSAIKVSLLEQKGKRIERDERVRRIDPFTPCVCQIANQIDCLQAIIYFFLPQVVDIENGDELGPNKEGEICVKGPTVMKGEGSRITSGEFCSSRLKSRVF